MNSDWAEILLRESSVPYFLSLQKFIVHDRAKHSVFPPEEDIFAALEKTSLGATKVVMLGQDPYHGAGQAHGLAFSVQSPMPPPPTLRNIFKELQDDIGVSVPLHGDLTSWARQGVLLLNTTLTVREGQAGSHSGQGWETLTDAIISAVNEKSDSVVFLLWGAHARKKRALISQAHHVVIEGVHPSPLSAYRGFFGSRPFSRVNAALLAAGHTPIDWSLSEK